MGGATVNRRNFIKGLLASAGTAATVGIPTLPEMAQPVELIVTNTIAPWGTQTAEQVLAEIHSMLAQSFGIPQRYLVTSPDMFALIQEDIAPSALRSIASIDLITPEQAFFREFPRYKLPEVYLQEPVEVNVRV